MDQMMHTDDAEERAAADDRPLGSLDDQADRDELRRRYYGLLQELRVLLPGVQILVAFLLTVPFAERFPEVDRFGTALYGIALSSSALSVVAFVTPTAFHRVGPRQSRVERLRWGIRVTRAGLVTLSVALSSAFLLVTRWVFATPVASAMTAGLVVVMLCMWLLLPISCRERSR